MYAYIMGGSKPTFDKPSPIDDATATRSAQKDYDYKCQKADKNQEQLDEDMASLLMDTIMLCEIMR